jgi:hypothetical protein
MSENLSQTHHGRQPQAKAFSRGSLDQGYESIEAMRVMQRMAQEN